jgi:RNA polymerase sigma-70 factor (ECF subfamily)
MAATEEIIRRFLDGEEEAFSQIVQTWQGKVYSLAWRMLGNREDAQDIVQETFLSVFKSLRNLRDPARFSTWLYRIALNHCRSRRRSRPSDLSLSEQMFESNGDEERFPSGFPAAPRSGDQLETLDIIRKALAGLSEDHRTAIVLKEYVGLSLEEVASVMECPLSTAKSRLYHGLRDVQRNLKRMGICV